ncbi:P12 family lipoprotein [Borrelia persica]|uniref:P12 family lipoprotein n=1 Tax=Borrelia persica TaxID=44448 RepID=UPI001F335449|nr:P12 family lipoprotein [Borrelia persica]
MPVWNNTKSKRQKLIQLRDQLNEKRSHIDRLVIQVNSGLNERTSAKYLFEESQKTLKKSITERLKNVLRYSFRRASNYFLLVQLSI